MAHEKNHDYHILNPSLWPFLSALGAFILLFGSVLFMRGEPKLQPLLSIEG